MPDNPDSKVFYPNNYSGKRFAGASLARVKVKGEKVSVYVKVLTVSKKTGTLYEHLSTLITYSTHINEHGAKYLKVGSKAGQGSTIDASLELAAFGDVLYFDQFLSSSDTLKTFLEETISGWFNIPYVPGELKERHWMFFPSLAIETRPLLKAFREVDSLARHNGRVAQVLRASADASSALKSLCGETVQSEEDVVAIVGNPELLQFAEMELGMTISEFVSVTPVPQPLNTRPTRAALKFMLAHLTGDKKDTVVSIVQDITNSPMLANELSASSGRMPYWRPAGNFINSCLHLDLSQSQRKALAEELFQCFTLPVKEVVGRFAHGNALKDRFSLWMAVNVVESEVASEATVEDVESVFRELLMPDCTHGIDAACEHAPAAKGFQYHTNQRGTTFCTVSDSYALTLEEGCSTDLTSNLVLLAGKADQILCLPLGGVQYLNNEGKGVTLGDAIYPLDRVIQLIRRGVKEADKQLIKLGRSITPQNRVAYLTFGSKERKFKNTWRYYDSGVTEPSKILALKKYKITNKKDIEMYALLPDDMFYDFLETESGETLTLN